MQRQAPESTKTSPESKKQRRMRAHTHTHTLARGTSQEAALRKEGQRQAPRNKPQDADAITDDLGIILAGDK